MEDKIYGWDEVIDVVEQMDAPTPEVVGGLGELPCPSWAEHDPAAECRVFRSERGHLALECRAPDKTAAQRKMAKALLIMVARRLRDEVKL